ncbi:hypothetical protein LEP1GSC150_0368 [Leptospira interrogans serovar Copenhageni str. LT2050]|uniref:Response regulatory domain-containing protein n=1 Tax=Leptospira interrogans serovar Copenhageni str. LT2050 TaxID=1001598 RepID=M3ITN3_LEPIT|nr:hypothetical protein LEP1GSC150_0368 [Leptospira interrogans serovar Copenhageni str. LT2050]KPA32609.1 Uncharacterized protein AMR50_2710 [Leptospira interrogans]
MFSDEISVCLIEDDDEDAILFREYLEEIPFPKYKVTRFKDFPSLFVDIEKTLQNIQFMWLIIF